MVPEIGSRLGHHQVTSLIGEGAKVIASLNHPNIGHMYGLEQTESDGRDEPYVASDDLVRCAAMCGAAGSRPARSSRKTTMDCPALVWSILAVSEAVWPDGS